MNVSPTVNTPVKHKKNGAISAAAKGALFTASVLGTSTAFSWLKEPQVMRDVVVKTGGKAKYAMNYAAWLAIYSAAGAVINTALSGIAKIVKPNHPPKAN